MTSIFDSLDIAQRTLMAQQFGLEITQKNIANANNPNYTRQVVNFTYLSDTSGNSLSAGISEATLTAYRNRYIEYSISQELQLQSQYDTEATALRQIDTLFNENSGKGLQAALSDFFNSFSYLANTPEDLILRQQVLSRATALTAEFHRLYDKIQLVQMSADNAVRDTVNDINVITAQIADMNVEVAIAQAAESNDESMLLDIRQQLVEQLSNLIDVSYFETESGYITVTTRQGSLLVAGDQSSSLQTAPLPASGFLGVSLDNVDITSTIQSGKLGGLLNLRDTKIAGYLTALDDMAATIIAQVNAQHVQGIDLGGGAGGDFFTPFTQPLPGSNAGAARTMTVALQDPALIAAAAPGSGPGNNINAQLLSGIKDLKIFSMSSETANQYYANLIFTIGNDGKIAEESLATQDRVLAQLKNQRAAFSGVNLDEEAVNIIKYQKAYVASARIISTLDSLSEELLQLLGG